MHLLQAEIRMEQHEAVAAAEVAVTAATDAVDQVGVAVGDVGRLVEGLSGEEAEPGPDALA
jgi:transcription antitermination factor NusA-like protein